MAPEPAPSSRVSPRDPTRAAAVVGYLAVLTVAWKLARAVELALRTGSLGALQVLPLTFGDDLVLIASLGILAHACARLRRPRLQIALLLLVLAPIAMLAPADVVAHRLIGEPLTWARLRGDEGATLADLGLLDARDLVGGLGGITVALAMLWPAFALAHRLRWLTRWARPRALLMTLLVGAGLVVAQRAFVSNDYGLGAQPAIVFAQSLLDDGLPVASALSDREWAELHRPRRPPADRERPPPLPVGHARNVVIFLTEGIPYKYTGFAPEYRRRNPTPNLVRRQRRDGMLFNRYYANWHASIQAIFSVVCSAFPPLKGDIVRVKPRIDCGELSEVLHAQGVSAGLFHGGQFAFYNKLALLGGRAYSVELDAEELARTKGYRSHQWGIDDRAMVDATLRWIDSLPKNERFAALMIPITAHYPYWTPNDFEPSFRPERGRVEPFLRAVAFQDQVFEYLLTELEKRGRYEDTLFVWLGDHGHGAFERPRISPVVRGVYEPNLHTPLVLVNPRMFPPSLSPKARVSNRVGSHMDLLPTILDALGLSADPRHAGQSLLAPTFEPRRVFIAGQDGQRLGFIEHEHKFILHTRSGRTEYYDLDADPEERRDLSAEVPELVREFSDVVRRFAGAVRARIDSAPELHERVSVRDVYRLFLRDVEVSISDGQNRVACTPDTSGLGRTCPGLGSVLREKTAQVQGEKRHCLFVRVPAQGNLELEIDDPDVLDLLHGTIVAMPGRPTRDERFRISTRVDGRNEGLVSLSSASAVRPQHPRAHRTLRYLVSRAEKTDTEEICFQLTTLVP